MAYYSDKKLISENRYIARGILKYGRDNFILEIICFSEEDSNILDLENIFLNLFFGEYNIAQDAQAPMKGRKHSEETKAKISASNKGLNKGLISVNRKPVIGIPIDGTAQLTFESVMACGKELGISQQAVRSAIKNNSLVKKKYRLYYK